MNDVINIPVSVTVTVKQCPLCRTLAFFRRLLGAESDIDIAIDRFRKTAIAQGDCVADGSEP